MTSAQIRPFRIDVPQRDLDDLRAMLEQTTAIATLAVFAFITAIFAWLAFRKESRRGMRASFYRSRLGWPTPIRPSRYGAE